MDACYWCCCWRRQRDTRVARGQFSCGCLGCESRDALESYELNFAFVEAGERRAALVKVRACPGCAVKLFYGREGKRKRARPLQSNERGRDDDDAHGGDAAAGGGGGGRSVRRRHGGDADTAPRPADAAGVTHEAVGAGANCGGGGSEQATAAAAAASAAWSKPPEAARTREDEIEDYFAGMFP